MLFWIMVGITVWVIAWIWVWHIRERSSYWGFEWGSAFGYSAVAAAIGAAVTFLVTFTLQMLPINHEVAQRAVTHDLRAMAASSEVEGRMYLLGGYVDEDPVLRFIRAEGDGFVLRSVPADDSTIFEGFNDPHLDVITTTYGNEWISPFTFDQDTFEFYVPEGSVSSEIQVAP